MDSSHTIVVFGGAGFIAHHLLKRLSQQSSARLISVDIKDPQHPVSGVDYQKGDVRDLSSFEIEGPIERIYNLAAIHTTPGHPTHAYYETNIAGATQITAFARHHKVNEIVFTSSISVYGPSEDQKDEKSPPSPESAYGWSKYLAEGIHQAWLAENSDRRLVIVRPAVIFGAHEGGNFTRMARLLKKGFFIYPGRKDTIKACFYVEDLLDAVDFAVNLKRQFVLFNGCYPDRYTIEQIISAFRRTGFDKIHTFTLPYLAVRLLAATLRPFASLNLGIHPDRVTKLVKSTDIFPSWLVEQKMQKAGGMDKALEHWKDLSNGAFE